MHCVAGGGRREGGGVQGDGEVKSLRLRRERTGECESLRGRVRREPDRRWLGSGGTRM